MKRNESVMDTDKKYRKIERELNEIVIAEINARFVGKPKKPDFDKLLEILEHKNREIVLGHQKKTIAGSLASVLGSFFQIQERGRLWLDKDSLSENEFRNYEAKRSRLDALLSAAIISLEDENLIQIVHDKKRLFAEKYLKAKTIDDWAEEVRAIQQSATDGAAAAPKDEASAVAYLKDILPLKARLKTIETQLLEVQQDDYLDESLQKLRTSLTEAAGSLSKRSGNAAKYLFDRSGAVFQSYKSTPATVANVDKFIRQKEELERYAALFDDIGDESRKEKIQGFIATIEAGIISLQQDIEKQKLEEATSVEKTNRDINEAYQAFVHLKDEYAKGKYSSEKDKKKLIAEMKKYRDVLLANGQRIKARDIERFLNSTEIEKKEELPTRHQRVQMQELLFYKKAFFTLLPFTIGLALFVLLRLLF